MTRKRVLVAEDDSSIAFLIKDGLADLGATFDVEVVSSGEEALKKIEQNTWDLVITDHRMPGITGLQLIETLSRQNPFPLTILMTGYGSEEVEQAAKSLRIYHYMTKPFPLADLKRIIDQALAYSQNTESSNSNGDQARQPLKITLSGDGTVGKTTLIKRLCTGKFDSARVMTIGVDFHLYDVQRDSNPTRIIVWDVSGQDQSSFTRRAFYRGSKAIGLVYAVNHRESFERLTQRRAEIQSILPDVPLVLAGNKIDLERQVSAREGMLLAESWGIPFFETSCLTGNHVHNYFRALTDAALQHARTRVLV